jgi:signal transduction histidine kinase
VAAVGLLSPLQKSLRREEIKSLEDTAITARSSFRELPVSSLHPENPSLRVLAARLQRRTGARVAIFTPSGLKLADTAPAIPFGPIPETPEEDQPHGRVVVTSQAADVARVAVLTKTADSRIVVALRKPLDDVQAAARDVRIAFTDAALVGLGVALILGVGIAGTLLRRLRRLRTAALDVAEHGLGGADLPEDRSRDEVGDLSRAFARMQSRLRHEEDARRNFVATASHEMRTPLASLQGMLELLEQDLVASPPDLSDARAQAQRAQEQTRRLKSLAADLLDLTRLDAEVELRNEPVELREVCRAVVAEFDVRAGSKRIELRPDDAEAPCWATADPGSVARVVRILVDNALRYSPSDQVVAVIVDQAGKAASIAVEDSGPGVPVEEREVIFERFRRGSNPDAERGFGLGLAIGRELARRMAGDLVLAERDAPGARFELRLPGASVERARPVVPHIEGAASVSPATAEESTDGFRPLA